MFNQESLKELIKKIVAIQAPSGFEEPMMRFLKNELEPLVDEVYDTPRGNIIGIQKSKDPNALKIAIVAHMDQIGLTVFNIDSTGFIRFKKIGGIVSRALQGQHVRILTEKGAVYGVIGLKPGHVTPASEANTIPSVDEMYIDVGARSREEATKLGIKMGLPISYSMKPLELAYGYMATPSLDDSCGIATLIILANEFKKNPIKQSIYYVGTVEEEIGLRGAEVALNGLDLDLAIAIDTTSAGFQPDVNMREIIYEVGKGPAIHIAELGAGIKIESQLLVRWLEKIALKHKIPYQIGFQHGGTDAMALMQTGSGIPSCSIGLPRHYSHSPIETFQLNDLENLIILLQKAVSEINDDFKLNRI
ncbi:M20/M25/M40 family metallo-hydrolase [Candidatus Bathyarchaeota archaeon]|nr:M20/M25/M40 family metallo-hydrolase [Candidatus Bathyarchaeota archaeon]